MSRSYAEREPQKAVTYFGQCSRKKFGQRVCNDSCDRRLMEKVGKSASDNASKSEPKGLKTIESD